MFSSRWHAFIPASGSFCTKGEPTDSSPENPFGDRVAKYANLEQKLWDDVRKHGVDCPVYLTVTEDLARQHVFKQKLDPNDPANAVQGIAGPSL